ncbi:hypothetical protein [Bergeyella sp. RCAD1439]|uniref:hypothetical protein n=1 Tax=Bergeyella anatis TaxID=3113737 RepID=UPI002E1852EE|nr:hypothetical protein [Bergeyella sp. RCAD1439]
MPMVFHGFYLGIKNLIFYHTSFFVPKKGKTSLVKIWFSNSHIKFIERIFARLSVFLPQPEKANAKDFSTSKSCFSTD